MPDVSGNLNLAFMKTRTILYYPTIDVPTNSWLRHSLLYWDEISSIIPQSWSENYRDNLSPDINYLIDEEQFRPIKPDELIEKGSNRELLQAFQQEFIDTISSNSFQAFIKQRPFYTSRLHIDKVSRTKMVSRVHRNKTSDDIFYFLEDLGLATRNEDYGECFQFENHTALIYMSLLAKYLAEVDEKQTTIGTDYGIYEKFNFKKVNETRGFPVVSFSLNNVLPIPTPNVPLEKIIDFKRKRKDELLNFRKILMEFQGKISKVKSNQELKEVSVSFKENVQVGIKTLEKTIKDYRLETRYKSLKSLINLKSPTFLVSAAAIANEKYNFLHIPIAIKLAGLATIGFIDLRGTYIEVRNKQLAKTRDSAFSYLLKAQNIGIVKASR